MAAAPRSIPGTGGKVSSSLWQQGLAELIGAFIFTFLSAAAVTSTGKLESENVDCARIVSLALVDGFTFYAIVNLTMRLTYGFGGYFNPALTLGLAFLDIRFDGRFLQHAWRFVFFLVAQLAGATGGAFLTLAALPDPLVGREDTGVSRPPNHGGQIQATVYQAFAIEALMGLFLALVTLAVRRHEKRRSSLILALAYTAIRIVSMPLSGGYVNPARSFGSAVVGGGLDVLWVYLFGSPLGAIVGVLCFHLLHSDDVDVDDVFQNAGEDDDDY